MRRARPAAIAGAAVTYGYVAMVLHGIFGGAYWPLQKQLTRYLTPLEVNWAQMAFAALLMLPVCAIRFRVVLRREAPLWPLVAFGGVSTAIFYARTLGIDLTSASTAVIVTRSEIVFSLVMSYLILGQYITGWGWAGAGLLVVGSVAPLRPWSADFAFGPLGLAALIFCAFGTAVNGVIIKRYLTETSNELIVLTSVLSQAAILSLIVLPRGAAAAVLGEIAVPAVGPVLAASVLALIGMLYLYYYALERICLPHARVLALTIPAVAVLGEAFWLGARLGAADLVGLLCVTAGALLVIFLGSQRPGEVFTDDIQSVGGPAGRVPG